MELAKLRDALFMPQPSSAMSATAQLAELEKQELEKLRERHRRQQTSNSGEQEGVRAEMFEAIGELTVKRQKITEDVAAEAVAAEAARQPVP